MGRKLNMHNPTTLFAGRVTGRPDQMAATGPRPSTQPLPPQPDQQPGPPPQPAPPRRARIGQYLPRAMLGLMFILCMTSSAAEQLPADQNRTMVLGWDCSRPTAIDTYERSSFCSLGRPTPKPGHPTAEYAIAQVTWVSDIEGWDCSAVSTLTTHICGLWGYEKAVPSMSGRTLLKLKPAECDRIVRRGVYKTVQGRVITGIGAPGYTTTQFNNQRPWLGWDTQR